MHLTKYVKVRFIDVTIIKIGGKQREKYRLTLLSSSNDLPSQQKIRKYLSAIDSAATNNSSAGQK
ncbi:hypothetical protein KDI_47400 [Dictyobacter arantiisoli]|uniref:Uncharacterized protein n=1 Tax=Dictyobacter arantiisoli TaxID=2014874 RepID=A0A5A5TJ74_9CHLR|nr:hypothetical protein KDI_47400 [Dictyobacter arantiisoli]